MYIKPIHIRYIFSSILWFYQQQKITDFPQNSYELLNEFNGKIHLIGSLSAFVGQFKKVSLYSSLLELQRKSRIVLLIVWVVLEKCRSIIMLTMG